MAIPPISQGYNVLLKAPEDNERDLLLAISIMQKVHQSRGQSQAVVLTKFRDRAENICRAIQDLKDAMKSCLEEADLGWNVVYIASRFSTPFYGTGGNLLIRFEVVYLCRNGDKSTCSILELPKQIWKISNLIVYLDGAGSMIKPPVDGTEEAKWEPEMEEVVFPCDWPDDDCMYRIINDLKCSERLQQVILVDEAITSEMEGYIGKFERNAMRIEV